MFSVGAAYDHKSKPNVFGLPPPTYVEFISPSALGLLRLRASDSLVVDYAFRRIGDLKFRADDDGLWVAMAFRFADEFSVPVHRCSWC